MNMSRRKRSKLLIVMNILEALAEKDIAPTRLSVIANMPYDRLVKLLKELEAQKLIEIVDTGRSKVVKLTSKGYKLLNELRKIKKILDEYGLL